MARRSSKPERSKLPDQYRQFLEAKDYDLQVEISTLGYCDSSDFRTIAHPVRGAIQIVFEDSEGRELDPIKIGVVTGWRAINSSIAEVTYWSDKIDQSTYNAFVWLLHEQTEVDQDYVLLSPVLFIESVVINPMWRGQGLTLIAAATFLDIVNCNFVFFQPEPLNSNELPYRERAQMRCRLRKYWRKLGFKHYDEEHNYMWNPTWSCPKWLSAPIDLD